LPFFVLLLEQNRKKETRQSKIVSALGAAHPGNQINTFIQNLIDQSNQVLSNSAISTQFNVVHTEIVTYPDDNSMQEALEDLTNNVDVFSHVEDLRTVHGADQVTLLRQYVDEGCGMAWVLNSSSPRSAYAVVHVGNKTDGSGYYCSDFTYVHEIGHNLGCAHDRANASVTGRYEYSYGYQSPTATFRTVMAYNCLGDCPQLPYFSNPDLQYNGESLGVLHTAGNSADNARTINQTRVEMANYRAATGTVYTLTISKQGNGTVTSNPAGISCGSTCSSSFNSGQSVTLTASAALGSTFAGWSGACSGTGTCTVSMTEARSVTATFNKQNQGHTPLPLLPQVYQLLLKQ
jgi:hypothetical protein